MFRKYYYLLPLFILLSACGAIQKGYEGSKKVGKETFELKQYRYDINIVSNKKLNETNKISDNTVKFTVYQLSDPTAFKQASYYDLLTNSKNLLSKDLIKEHSEIIYPFSTQNINQDVDKNAKFLGLVFLFNQPKSKENTWKMVVPIDDLSVFKSSYILVESSEAKLVKKKFAKDLIAEQKKIMKEKKQAEKELKKNKEKQ